MNVVKVRTDDGGITALITDGTFIAATTIDPTGWWRCHACNLHIHKPHSRDCCHHLLALGLTPVKAAP